MRRVPEGLRWANWYANHRSDDWRRHVARGAAVGAVQGLGGYGVARVVASRFPTSATHRSARGLWNRYWKARKSFSPSNVWSVGRAVRSVKQARFKSRYD